MTINEAVKHKHLQFLPWWIRKSWFHWGEIVKIEVVLVEKHTAKSIAVDMLVTYDCNGVNLTFEESRFAPIRFYKEEKYEAIK